MQSSNVVRGYSEFFTSGLLAVTGRAQATSSNTLSTLDENSHRGASKPRRTLADLTHRRARPTSMIISGSSTTHDKAERRTSLISVLSSRFFDRKPLLSQDEKSSISSSKRNSLSSTESIPEVWTIAGCHHTPSAPNGRPAIHQSNDPFASSPDTRSIFIDLSPVDSPPDGTPKRESFLSLTGSSNRSSSLFARSRERPTSMPLPSHSRRSSFQHWSPTPSQDKSDFFLILEEPGLPSESASNEEWDAPAKTDWRQFHIDILIED